MTDERRRNDATGVMAMGHCVRQEQCFEAELRSFERVPEEVHESGWQWRPVSEDTAFAPPFGTIRMCIACGCLVAGGPTRCARCAPLGTEGAKPEGDRGNDQGRVEAPLRGPGSRVDAAAGHHSASEVGACAGGPAAESARGRCYLCKANVSEVEGNHAVGVGWRCADAGACRGRRSDPEYAWARAATFPGGAMGPVAPNACPADCGGCEMDRVAPLPATLTPSVDVWNKGVVIGIDVGYRGADRTVVQDMLGQEVPADVATVASGSSGPERVRGEKPLQCPAAAEGPPSVDYSASSSRKADVYLHLAEYDALLKVVDAARDVLLLSRNTDFADANVPSRTLRTLRDAVHQVPRPNEDPEDPEVDT